MALSNHERVGKALETSVGHDVGSFPRSRDDCFVRA